MSGHSLYRTIAAILALVSLGALPMLAGIALLPVKLAFLEWSRKSELSADRAGLLGCQDVMVAQRLDLKMAGGGRGEFFTEADLNLDAFMAQANEYTSTNEGLDIVYKVLHTLGVTHPMHTVRAAEIQKWVAAGDYERILAGEYVRRGQPRRPAAARRPLAGRQGVLLQGGEGLRPPGRRRGPQDAGEGRRGVPQRPEARLQRVKVLIVGGGGREHALAWALRREDPAVQLYAAPGNPGIAGLATNLPIPSDDVDRLADAAVELGSTSPSSAPRSPLALGLADRLRARGRRSSGRRPPRRRIEASKAFSKDVMEAAGVPTAASRTFTELAPALAYVDAHAEPLVVKASGLAAGKGAIVCATRRGGRGRGARHARRGQLRRRRAAPSSSRRFSRARSSPCSASPTARR